MKILGLFSHWKWFLDTQNGFCVIVNGLKNALFRPPLHQGQLRSMVGFPSTWLEINPSRLDFQPLVRNPTAGWYSTHWMVRIPTILPLCIKYRNLSRAPQIVETFRWNFYPLTGGGSTPQVRNLFFEPKSGVFEQNTPFLALFEEEMCFPIWEKFPNNTVF